GPGGAYAMPPQRKTSGAANAALIFGILGCVPLITGLIAIVCGFIGIRTTRDPRYSGRGMAVAGLILGLLSVLIWGIVGGTAGLGGWMAYTYTKPAREAAKQLAADLAAGEAEGQIGRVIRAVKAVPYARRVQPCALAAATTRWTADSTSSPVRVRCGSRKSRVTVTDLLPLSSGLPR